MKRAEAFAAFLILATVTASGAILAIVTLALLSGCGVSNPTFVQTTDGGRIVVDADPPGVDGDALDADSLPDLLPFVVDSGATTVDSGVVDLAKPVDLLPAPSDLACLPFVADPVGETACAPGQEQNTKTGPSMCYRKTCGCTNRVTCTDCYWSSWTPVGCPP